MCRPYFTERRPTRTSCQHTCHHSTADLQETIQQIHGSCFSASVPDIHIDVTGVYNIPASILGGVCCCPGNEPKTHRAPRIVVCRKKARRVKTPWQRYGRGHHPCNVCNQPNNYSVSALLPTNPLETNGITLKSPLDISSTVPVSTLSSALPGNFPPSKMAPFPDFVNSPLEAPLSEMPPLFPSYCSPDVSHSGPECTNKVQNGQVKYPYLPPPPLPPFATLLSIPPPQTHNVTSHVPPVTAAFAHRFSSPGDTTNKTVNNGRSNALNNSWPLLRSPPYRHPLNVQPPTPPSLRKNYCYGQPSRYLHSTQRYSGPADVTSVCGNFRKCTLKHSRWKDALFLSVTWRATSFAVRECLVSLQYNIGDDNK